MVNKLLYISLNIFNKNIFLMTNYQTHLHKIIALFKAIFTPDFNTIIISLL